MLGTVHVAPAAQPCLTQKDMGGVNSGSFVIRILDWFSSLSFDKVDNNEKMRRIHLPMVNLKVISSCYVWSMCDIC